MKPAADEPIFKGETMKAIGKDGFTRPDKTTVPGKAFEVELTTGDKIHVWRADNGEDYFCHGLTFGGKAAPGGAISPYGRYVPTILRGYYEPVPEAEARAGDILVWRGPSANDVIHSAILTDPGVLGGQNYLDEAARLQTKNGLAPETNMSLEEIISDFYGESYNVFRKRAKPVPLRSEP